MVTTSLPGTKSLKSLIFQSTTSNIWRISALSVLKLNLDVGPLDQIGVVLHTIESWVMNDSFCKYKAERIVWKRGKGNKSKVKISQDFVASSEYMNFNMARKWIGTRNVFPPFFLSNHEMTGIGTKNIFLFSFFFLIMKWPDGYNIIAWN